MHIVVIGGGGFIGSHLLDRLFQRDDIHVTVWDGSAAKIAHHRDDPRLTLREEHVRPGAALARLEEDVASCDWLVHLAAICTPARYNTEPLETIHANFTETLPLVEMAARHGRRLLYLSTSEVYGRTLASHVGPNGSDDPALYMLDADTTPLVLGPIANQRWTYAAAKQLTERLIYAHHTENGLPFAIVRPFNFFGPRMDYLPGIEGEGTPRVLPIFVANMLRGLPLQLVGGGAARRTITSIHDAIDALVAIIDKPDVSLGHIYNIGNPGNEVTMRELAEAVRASFARVTGEREFLNHRIEDVTPADFYGPGYEDSDRRIMDISKESARLGWTPQHRLDTLLDEIVTHYWGLYGASLCSAS